MVKEKNPMASLLNEELIDLNLDLDLSPHTFCSEFGT